MKKIRLSQIEDTTLTDELIDSIVYSNLTDDGQSSTYAIVFGNQMLLEKRVETAVAAYKMGRIRKMIFTGGISGVSNWKNLQDSEAKRMKKKALSLGVREYDILIEETSCNTFENIDKSVKLLPYASEHIAIITSEFHLKRCYALFKKNIHIFMSP